MDLETLKAWAFPSRDGMLCIVEYRTGPHRQIVLIEDIERLSDEALEVEVPHKPEAGAEIFVGLVASALGVLPTSGVALVLGNIIAVAANALVGLGLSLIERALFGQGRDRGIPPPSQVPIRQLVKQSTPRKRYVYGRALVGGAYCYLNKNPPYLLGQWLIAAHRCDAIEALYIGGFRCEFNSNGESITPRFRRGGTPYIELSTRLGDPDQAIDPLLASEFPDVPTSFRQRGQTVATVRAYYGVDYDDHEDVYGPVSTFAPQFVVRGKLIHDPRVYSSDPDDESTWVWSANWALCLADWMRSDYGGRKKVAQIDYDAVSAEADICDQSIGLSGGGTERRYTLNGGLQSDESPFSIVEAMLAAAGESACLWRRGQFAPLSDVPRQGVRTLTQGDLVSGFGFRSGRPRGESLNTVRSEFIYPSRDYKAALTPPIVDSALVTSDAQILEATLQRPFVAGEERAQRLDKITLKRSRLGREMKITVGIEHLDLEVGDEIRIEFADFPDVNGDYVIRMATAGGLMRTIELVLQEAAPAEVHEWSTGEVQSTDLVEIINPEAL